MTFDLILRITTKLLMPFMLVFALYVHFHGDYGPGGGFQAGVIAAGMVILYAIVFGKRTALRAVPTGVANAMVPLGVFIYLVAGLPGLFGGRGFLDYSVYHENHAKAQEWGIIAIEIGVLVSVAGTMISMFYAFIARGR
ncbi:MAG: Na(+)/H(+) antiporter subunit B [Pseudomonadota bacterium]